MTELQESAQESPREFHDSGRLLALADELEREHEKAKRDRLIVRAKDVYAATMGHETALAAVVDAVLAEVVDQ